MKCPACSGEMIVVERHGIELDYSIGCKGIWFDSGELRLLSQALGVEIELPDWLGLPEADTGERYRRCPRCNKKMRKKLIGEVLLDACPNGHGIWFDGGELGRFLEQQGSEAPEGGAQVIEFLGETFKVGIQG